MIILSQQSHAEVWLDGVWGMFVLLVVSDLSVLFYLIQLFALQTESRDQRDGDEMVHHKLPVYVQNMDRLGDTEL